MLKNKYEADNSRFGEVLTQVLSAHGIGAPVSGGSQSRQDTVLRHQARPGRLQSEHLRAHSECHA